MVMMRPLASQWQAARPICRPRRSPAGRRVPHPGAKTAAGGALEAKRGERALKHGAVPRRPGHLERNRWRGKIQLRRFEREAAVLPAAQDVGEIGCGSRPLSCTSSARLNAVRQQEIGRGKVRGETNGAVVEVARPALGVLAGWHRARTRAGRRAGCSIARAVPRPGPARHDGQQVHGGTLAGPGGQQPSAGRGTALYNGTGR